MSTGTRSWLLGFLGVQHEQHNEKHQATQTTNSTSKHNVTKRVSSSTTMTTIPKTATVIQVNGSSAIFPPSVPDCVRMLTQPVLACPGAAVHETLPR